MYVQQATWREGEIEVVVVDRDERAVKIEHTLSDYIAVIVGHRETRDYIAPLWEIRCMEPKSCHMCLRIPLDPSVCINVGDSDTIKRLLKKLLKQLDMVEAEEVIKKLLEKIREYIEKVVE